MKIVKVLFVVFLMMGLISCGGQKKESSVQLIWWGDIYNRNFAQKLVEAYNNTNPAMKVSLITPIDYWIKLQTMLAGGTAPDVFVLNAEQAYELADKGALLSLDDYKSDPAYSSFQEDTWKSIKDQITYKEHLYAIPIWTNSVGIFYNKDLFDEAGLEYPSGDWDMEELLEKSKRLTLDTNKDGHIDQFGFGGISLRIGVWDIHMLIKAFGGELYSEDLKECLINTPEGVAAVRWAVELITKHHVSPSHSEISSTKGVVSASGMDLFRMGEVAMVLWGRWYMDSLSKGTNFRWGAAPFPRGKEKVMFDSPTYLGVFSGTKHPQSCWEFVKFVMSEHGQRILALDRTDIPVLRSLSYSSEFLNYAGREDVNKLFLDMLEYSEAPRYLPGKGEWQEFARLKIELVALGQLSVQDACDQIAAAFHKMAHD